jgi:tripartite-type tricarboxylate transporter receptor subunit TctC
MAIDLDLRDSFFRREQTGRVGTIGAQAVVRAAPDGYTLLALDNSFSLLPFVFKKLPWERFDHTHVVSDRGNTPSIRWGLLDV